MLSDVQLIWVKFSYVIKKYIYIYIYVCYVSSTTYNNMYNMFQFCTSLPFFPLWNLSTIFNCTVKYVLNLEILCATNNERSNVPTLTVKLDSF